MRISTAALAAAKSITDNRFPVVWYIPPDKPVVIGYGVFPAATVDKKPAQNVAFTLLDSPDVTVQCTYVRHAKGEPLFWLKVKQSAGPVCYRWTDPEGTVQHFVACADNEADTADAREAAVRRTRRRQQVWQLMQRTGWRFEAVNRAYEAVDKNVNLVVGCFRLIDLLMAKHGGSEAAVWQELKSLQEGDPTDPGLRALLVEARVNTTQRDAVVAILRGAGRAVHAE